MESHMYETIIASASDERVYKKAAELLRQDETVAFPTETVYGLGANALRDEAVLKIFQAKGRPSDNPLIVHIADEDQLDELVQDIPDVAIQCMRAFWPGPLTLVMKKRPNLSRYVTAGLDTVGIRMPSHPVAMRLIRQAGLPIAAPSANRSGRPSPTEAVHVWEDLKGKIPLIVDGGATQVGFESTVLDVTVTPPLVLRPGDITLEMLQEVIGEVQIDPGLAEPEAKPKSPGMKYTHYAPKGAMTVIQGDPEKVRVRILELCKNEMLKHPNRRVGVLLATWQKQDDQYVHNLHEAGVKTVLSPPMQDQSYLETLRAFGATLYASLRDFDGKGIDTIFAEGVPMQGVGIAIMNRMRKAAGNQVIEL